MSKYYRKPPRKLDSDDLWAFYALLIVLFLALMAIPY